MPGDQTVARLFELAIELEKIAEAVYHELVTKFAYHRRAAEFWQGLAQDEAEHAQWLGSLRDQSSAEQLSAAADAQMLENAHRALRFCQEDVACREIKNLEDAFRLASELEGSEVNVIFDFLITHYSSDEKTRSFLRNVVKTHTGKLMKEFVSGAMLSFSAAGNQGVKPTIESRVQG